MTPILALAALQMLRGRGAVDPATYASRSGACELHVEASQVDGKGSGSYRLVRGGSEVWAGMRPFTLLDARVSEEGRVFGYSLSEGRRAVGELHVVVLAPDGAVLQDERHPREHSRYPDGDPDPNPIDLLLVSSADAGVLRVSDADVNRGLESWWVYRLSTGAPLEAPLPAARLGRDDDPCWKIMGAAALEPQGLVLACGYGWHGGGMGDMDEQWFALLEPAGDVVWRSEDAHAFGAELGGVGGHDLVKRVRERGLPTPPAGADMRLWRVAQGAAVDYRVQRSSAAEHGWSVVEVGRQGDQGLPEPAPPVVEPERHELRPLGTVPLEAGEASSAPELGPVAEWAFDAEGGLRVVRAIDRTHYEQLRVDRAGQVVGTTPFPSLEPIKGLVKWAHLAGERWLVTQSPFGEGEARAFLADGAGGTLQALVAFHGPSVDAAAPAPDGGFVVLATQHAPSTQWDVVIACGPDGAQRWRRESPGFDEDDPSCLLSPEGLTVMPDGTVVLIDNVRHTLQFFGAGGEFLRAVDLDTAWGRELRYPTGVRCAPLGGLLVHDFSGSPPLAVVEGDGTLRAAFSPHLADGHTDPRLADEARYAPDGSLWTSDDHRFYRLDANGAEVEAVGEAPSAGVVHDPAAAAVDALGRVAIQDGRNGVVHVFGADGKRLATCVPDPTDFERVGGPARIVAGPDGGFVVENRRKGHVRFDPQGRRLGFLEEPAALDYLPNSKLSFVLSKRLELRDGDGLVARVEHLPSRRWLTGANDVFAFADGSFLVLSGDEVGSYGPDGTPRASYRLPHDGPTYLQTVSASERWILVSGITHAAWLIDRQDGATRVVVASGIPEETFCAMSLAPGGAEVLAVDVKALVLHRYALP